MISNGGYALLIGVNDYSSVGPAAALKGSREDVLKLYWFARVLLGLPPRTSGCSRAHRSQRPNST